MQDDEITLDPQEVQEEGEPVVEETTEEQSQETEEPRAEAEVKLSPAEYRHFKKWQASQSNPQTKAPTRPQTVSSQPNVEETVLLANGMPEELLGELKAIAKVRGVGLIKAQADHLFVAAKEKFEKDQKQREASLPASRGSGGVKPKKDFATPGLPRDEHRRMVIESR